MAKKQVVKSGFTLIEATLFLAIAGLLLFGMIITTNGVISAQRYNDSVRGFADFLKNQYADVLNVRSSSNNGGRSLDKAIYGQAIVFKQQGDKSIIETYQVTGNASGITKGNYSIDGSPNGNYDTLWNARIKTQDNNFYTGAIAIVRSPSTGSLVVYKNSNKSKLFEGDSVSDDIFFCIDSDDSSNTKAVKIDISGQTSDAVTIPDGDDLCN